MLTNFLATVTGHQPLTQQETWINSWKPGKWSRWCSQKPLKQ